MSQSMLERVAKAAHNFNVGHNPKIIFEDMPGSYQETWRRLAKATIEEIKIILKDHYWDSLEKDKELILKHIEDTLNV